MPFIHMLMNLKHISFVIKRRIDRLMKRREALTGKVDYRSMDLFDHSDKRIVDLAGKARGWDLLHGVTLSSSHRMLTTSK